MALPTGWMLSILLFVDPEGSLPVLFFNRFMRIFTMIHLLLFRFDRDFHFPLPSLPARKEILDIHLKSWTPSPSPSLVQYLSQKTVGYCGADLKVYPPLSHSL